MTPEALEHPFWWRVFERRDAQFGIAEVAEVRCVIVHEHENGSETPDLDVTALVVLHNGSNASIRAHYDHAAQRITRVTWYTDRPELPAATAA